LLGGRRERKRERERERGPLVGLVLFKAILRLPDPRYSERTKERERERKGGGRGGGNVPQT